MAADTITMKIDQHHGFLSASECAGIIEAVSESFTRAKVVSQTSEAYHPGRVAESAWLPQDHELSVSIKQRIADTLGLPTENMEQVSVVRYHVHGEYQPHVDWFDPADESFMACTLFGGQRSHSVLMYLDVDYTGGETGFPNLGLVIAPELGKMVVWPSRGDDGELSQDCLHAGLPVLSGLKHIAIVWVRDHRYWGE